MGIRYPVARVRARGVPIQKVKKTVNGIIGSEIQEEYPQISPRERLAKR
jgi:hypothetical protein